MSYNYPGQQQYSQGSPGHLQQQQYPPQGQAPQYASGNTLPPQQHQYGQTPQGAYPQQQGHPPQGHSPAPQGHSPAAGPHSPYPPQQNHGPPGAGMPRAGTNPGTTGAAPPDSGAFPGGSYAITHRDSNTILTVNLQGQGALVKSRPGAMVEMAGTVALAGKTKFSFSKMLTGGEMHESSYTGHGEVVLAPTLPGDIVALPIDGRAHWRIGKDAYLASAGEVIKENKMQGLGKALFSGEDLFVYNVHGNGIVWLKSFGAITRRDVSPSPPPSPNVISELDKLDD
ncbi:hypothetical protein N0V82_005955 [Gnomoniopsis sp. IMI 355080]|nr:hypothetical protein N0V82_005955 [Gnomoniopsis sp. IMI 355080]